MRSFDLPEKYPLLHNDWFWAVCLALLIGIAMLRSVNFNSATDSLGTLLTSQAILQHGTVRLDSYRKQIQQQPTPYNYQLIEHSGHLYYYYPVGTSLFALPVVAAANALGLDMAIDRHDRWLQRILSALSVGIVFLLCYALSRIYLAPMAALCFTIAMNAGSSFFSTMGVALWNLNFEVLFLLISLLFIFRDKHLERNFTIYGIALAGSVSEVL